MVEYHQSSPALPTQRAKKPHAKNIAALAVLPQANADAMKALLKVDGNHSERRLKNPFHCIGARRAASRPCCLAQ
jgi:hypothetical protein